MHIYCLKPARSIKNNLLFHYVLMDSFYRYISRVINTVNLARLLYIFMYIYDTTLHIFTSALKFLVFLLGNFTFN